LVQYEKFSRGAQGYAYCIVLYRAWVRVEAAIRKRVKRRCSERLSIQIRLDRWSRVAFFWFVELLTTTPTKKDIAKTMQTIWLASTSERGQASNHHSVFFGLLAMAQKLLQNNWTQESLGNGNNNLFALVMITWLDLPLHSYMNWWPASVPSVLQHRRQYW
jgi:hypothetical protein